MPDMAVERFEIVLHPVKACYRPGDPVYGSVFVHCSSDITFDDFNIELKGYGKVAWSEGNHHHGLNYTAEEEYAETWHHFVQQIVGYRHLLQQGQHQYPFVLHLPPNIPSSYSGAHGKVEYPLKCCMKRSWNEHDLTCEVSLPVASHSDLNNPLEASTSRRTSINKDKMLFRPGNIFATLFIDKTLYVPGETIYVSATIENNSNSGIESSTIKLVQRETCITPTSRKLSEKVVLKVKRGKVAQSETVLWDREAIVVPDIPPSGLPYCNIIDLSYEVKLIVNPGPFTGKLVESLKILIGTVSTHSLENEHAYENENEHENENENVNLIPEQ